MSIDHQQYGRDLVVRLAGELDLVSAAAFRTLADGLIDRNRVRNLYISLEQVTFLDSSFLGALIGRHKRIQQAGGRTGIIAPQPAVRPLLEIAGIFRLMPEYESERKALSAG